MGLTINYELSVSGRLVFPLGVLAAEDVHAVLLLAAADCGECFSRADSTTDQWVVTNQASEAGGAAVLEDFIPAGGG